jgi:hypothetical protein
MINHKRFLVTLLLIFLTGFTALADDQKVMSVQVKQVEVRSAPSFLGRIVARLSYGDQVYFRNEKGSWIRIGLRGNSTEGWIHTSALTPKKIVFKAGSSDVQTSASSDELALAGKGFNKQVENEFRNKNPNLDFSWIDRMEGFVVSQKQIEQFLKAGELSAEGGS